MCSNVVIVCSLSGSPPPCDYACVCICVFAFASAVNEGLEKKDAQLNEVLASANLAPSVLGNVNRKVEDVIEGKNQEVRDNQQELERVVRAHNDAIRAYLGKVAEYGIPMEELGFRPQFEQMPGGPPDQRDM